MLLLRPCLIALVLGGAVTSAVAEEHRLTVGVTDANSGRVLREVAGALVRKDARRAYARLAALSSGAIEYRGPNAIADGDVLIVYRRGFDLARIVLQEGQQGAKVALKPASRQCAINLPGADTEDVRLRLSWFVSAPGSWEQRPFVDSFSEQVVVGKARLPLRRSIPSGASVWVSVESKDRLYWPRTSFLAGASPAITLQEDAAWQPVLRLDSPAAKRRAAIPVAMFPDYAFEPPGPPARTDSWIWNAGTSRWGVGARPEDGRRLRVVPAVPVLAVACVDGVTVARRFRPGDAVIDLRRSARPRTLVRVPRVDGKPAPPASYVLAGRHDLATVGALLASQGDFPGLALQLPAERGRLPRECTLIAADWLTVWHPDHGLAHLRWPASEDAKGTVGDWYPCSMQIRAPPGWKLDGDVTAFPIWNGSGRVSATPPVEKLRRTVRGVASTRLRGLQPLWHAFVIRLDLVEDGTGRRHRVATTHRRLLARDGPRPAFTLRSPDVESAK